MVVVEEMDYIWVKTDRMSIMACYTSRNIKNYDFDTYLKNNKCFSYMLRAEIKQYHKNCQLVVARQN